MTLHIEIINQNWLGTGPVKRTTLKHALLGGRWGPPHVKRNKSKKATSPSRLSNKRLRPDRVKKKIG